MLSPDSEYFSKSSPEEPWFSRRGYRHPYELYHSPRHHCSPNHGDYPPEISSSWTPRSSPYHHDLHFDGEYPGKNESDGGLSVPCLGGEGRASKGKFSAKVHLAPRSSRPMIQQSRKPTSPPNFGRQDFRPPTPDSPRYQRSKESSFYYHCAPVEEEKKTSDVEGKDENISIARQSADVVLNPKVKISISPRPELSEPMSSLDQEGTPGIFVPVRAITDAK